MSEEIKMTDEELGIAPMKEVPTEHAGTIDDPIPQSLIFVKTDKNTGEKKVYSLGGGVGGGGVSSDVEVNPATDQIIGIVKLTDDHTVDAPAATGSIAITPNGVKVAIDTAKTEINESITGTVTDIIEDELQDGGKIDTAIGSAVDESIKDSIADGSLSGPIGDAVDQVVQDKIESGEIGGSTSPDATYVVRPTITTPTDGAADVSTLATITGTAYKCVFTDELRANRQFQLADNAQFTPLMKDISTNADSYSFTKQLPASKKIYVRIRDISASGYTSLWSEKVSFTTAEGQTVLTPTITLKGYNNSDTDILSGFIAEGSAFAVNEGSDTHESTSWKITKKTTGRSNASVWESLEDTTNKTTITVPDGTLEPSTDYVLTVIYHGKVAFDSAPAVVEFTTSDDFGTVAAPTLSVEGAPNDVYETPILTGGAFSNTRDPDTHDMTDWEILLNDGITSVYKSTEDKTNLTKIQVPEGSLAVSTAYKARVRYHGAKYGWSQYTAVDFSTVAAFNVVNTPSLTVQGAPDKVYETPTLTATVFGGINVTHKSTDWVILNATNNAEVWKSEDDATNLTHIKVPKGILQISTAYIFKMRYNANEGVSSEWVQVTATCVADFIKYNDIGVPGEADFGVGLAPQDIYESVGLEPAPNCTDPTNFQYGLYVSGHPTGKEAGDGVAMKWIPKFYITNLQKNDGTENLSDEELQALLPYVSVSVEQMKEAQRRSPHNAMVTAPVSAFTNDDEAKSHGFWTMRAFIDGGKKQEGFFIANTICYTRPTPDGIKAGAQEYDKDTAIALFRENTQISSLWQPEIFYKTKNKGDSITSGNYYRGILPCCGSYYQQISIFSWAVLRILSLIQGQYATDTSKCAWYDEKLVNNFPKGINSTTKDVNDATVVSNTVSDSASAIFVNQGYEKTTHNGSITGITNVNGWVYQDTCGAYAPNAYFLKEESSIYDIKEITQINGTDKSLYEAKANIAALNQTLHFNGANACFAPSTENTSFNGIVPWKGANTSSVEFGEDYGWTRWSEVTQDTLIVGGTHGGNGWGNTISGIFGINQTMATSNVARHGTRFMAYPRREGIDYDVGKWTPPKTTVKLTAKGNGGTPSTQTIEVESGTTFGEAKKKLTTPTRTGYTFAGWA